MYKRNPIVACYVFLFLFDYTSCVNGHMILRCNNAHNLVTNIHIATAHYVNLHTEWDVMATDCFGYNSFALSLSLFLPMRSLKPQRTRCLWLCRCLHTVVVAHIFHSLNFWFLTNHLRKWKLIFIFVSLYWVLCVSTTSRVHRITIVYLRCTPKAHHSITSQQSREACNRLQRLGIFNWSRSPEWGNKASRKF